jgi:hypothetical protein
LSEANIYEPQRCRHLAAPIPILADAVAALRIEANFLVVRHDPGRRDDPLCRRSTWRPDWKFAGKEVILDSRRIATMLAIPRCAAPWVDRLPAVKGAKNIVSARLLVPVPLLSTQA